MSDFINKLPEHNQIHATAQFHFVKRAEVIKPRCLTIAVHLGGDGKWWAHAYDDIDGPNNPIAYNGGALAWANDETPWDAVKTLLMNKEAAPYDE